MKQIFLFLFSAFLLASCGTDSSPEGRMTNRINEVHKELDTLKKQQAMILDSLGKIREQLKRMGNK